LLGAQAVGGLRAVQALVMPISALITAAVALLVPHMTNVVLTQGPHAQAALAKWLTIRASLVAAVAASALVAGSATIIRILYGVDYVRFHRLLIPFALSSLLQVVSLAAGVGLRALFEGRRVFLIQLVMSAAGLPALIVCTVTFGLNGAAWSTPVQTAIMTLLTWVLYRSSVKAHAKRRENLDVPFNSYPIA
jgi:O-antigen/teichoic acid export membrane protein